MQSATVVVSTRKSPPNEEVDDVFELVLVYCYRMLKDARLVVGAGSDRPGVLVYIATRVFEKLCVSSRTGKPLPNLYWA